MLFQALQPMLLESIKDYPVNLDHPDFYSQLKHDGFRCLAHVGFNQVELYSRHGNRFTQFPELLDIHSYVQAESAILDCELVIFQDNCPNLELLQQRSRLTDPVKIQRAVQKHPSCLVPFDLLYLNGQDLTQMPFSKRYQQLKQVLKPGPNLIPAVTVRGKGKALYEWAIENQWEGIVMRRADAPYTWSYSFETETRSRDVLKVKIRKELDVVIMGYAFQPFRILVGLHMDSQRVPVPIAEVEYGMKKHERLAFLNVVKKIHTHSQNGIQYIKPLLCCRISYLERTKNSLREAVFVEFLPGKQPVDCTWSQAV